MKFIPTLVALAIAAAAPSAFAQSTDLTITGKILPGACTVDLGNGGTADLGDINTRDLNAEEPTDLAAVSLSLTVACESPVRFALEGIDNAGDSSAYGGRYGLGKTPADEKIGGAELAMVSVTGDGADIFATHSTDTGDTWTPADNGTPALITMDGLTGFAKTQSATGGPDPMEALLGTLEVRARIQPRSAITIDDDVPINGSATINLKYL